MTLLGLTGGIGTGKSYVAALMRGMGIPTYDSDSRAKWLMQNDASLKSALTALVGEGLYGEDGMMDRKLMAAYIFADDAGRRAVESLVHPAVKCDFKAWTDEQESEFAVFESAILFESGFDGCVDFTVVVDAPLETRIRRCMERDGASRAEVESRMACQMSQQDKLRLARFVITNDGKTDLKMQILLLLEECKLNNKQ